MQAENSEGFVARSCPVCGEPKNELRDGKDFILRCHCEWKRGTLERLKKTVSQNFWKTEGKPAKNLSDWNPPIFRADGACRFQSLIEVQKLAVIHKMESFCFKQQKEGKTYRHALTSSVEQRKNMFIRGPMGSGRGLLVATIKMLAAGKDISATPNPGEWATFKSDLVASETFGPAGEAAKIASCENYADVALLTIENARSETEFAYESKDGFRKKWRGAVAADSVFIKRQCKPGSVVVTSFDFIRQIGDSFGDKLFELLCSPATSLALMFDKKEADSLLDGLRAKSRYYSKIFSDLRPDDSRTGIKERLAAMETLREAEDALYFEDAFPAVPGDDGLAEAKSLKGSLGLGGWPKQVMESFAKFNVNKSNNTMEYKDRIRRACLLATEACPSLAAKMTEKERVETGRMMSVACSPVERIEKLAAAAKEIVQRMAQ